MIQEEQRLEESRTRVAHWKRWGPYLSERAWGTVREDYSAGGTAWEFLPHEQARSEQEQETQRHLPSHQAFAQKQGPAPSRDRSHRVL